jgi:preprotein translocase subunit SecA
MLEDINRDVLAVLNKAYIPMRENNPDAVQNAREQRNKIDVNKLQASRMAAAAAAGQGERSTTAPIKVDKSVGRNDPCPCGSGKKYKHCHGKLG